MTHTTEKLDVMDTITTFSKHKHISVTRTFAVVALILMLVMFITCAVLICLLVHIMTPRQGSMQSTVACNCSEAVSTSTESYDTNATFETTGDDVSVPTTTSEPPSAPSPRLPRSIVPHSYEIYLTPFLHTDNFTFHGNVTIAVEVKAKTSNMTLHVDELDVDVSSVQVLQVVDGTLRDLVVEDVGNDTKMNFFFIYLREELQEGARCEIRMKFYGVLNDILQGFYRSSYEVNKEKR